MAKKEYAFYPGCSSQLKASASNYLVSTNSMCKTLDIKLTEIPDWNCCGASVGYCEGGELPRIAINGGRRGFLVQIDPQVCVQLLSAKPVQCALAE